MYQFAHSNLDTKVLYVAVDESTMLKIDNERVKKVPNGTDQVFFEPPNNWQPWKFLGDESYEEGIARKMLVDTVGFADTETFTSEEQAFLFEMAIMSTFLDPLGDLPPFFAHKIIRQLSFPGLRLRTAEPAKRSRPQPSSAM